MDGLLGITYSEFDNIVGPQLRFSFPPDVLPKDIFEPLSDYVIVGKHLCGKIIAVKTTELQFLNHSVSIDNSKYERNTLLFSFGFVLAPGVNTEPYEPLLRKISSVMVSLEIEKEFLFQPSAKQRIAEILPHLFCSLHAHGEAFLQLDAHNILALKPFRSISPQPRALADHEVPMLRFDASFMSNLPWDISLQHLLPSVDGVRCVKGIAREAEMDIDCVRRSLRTLLFYDCAVLVDIFRFSNVYQQCPGAAAALSIDSADMAEMEDFCAVGAPDVPSQQSRGGSGRSTSQQSPGSPHSPSWGGESLLPLPQPAVPHPPTASSSSSKARRHRMARILGALGPGRTLAEVMCRGAGRAGGVGGAAEVGGAGEEVWERKGGGIQGGAVGGSPLPPSGPGRGRGRDFDDDPPAQAVPFVDRRHATPPRSDPLPPQTPSSGKSPTSPATGSSLSTAGIDLRRLLAIAQVRGVIRRMHEFPVHGCMEREEDVAEDNDIDSADGSAQNSLNSSAQGSLGRRHAYAHYALGQGRRAKANGSSGAPASLPALVLDADQLSAINGSVSLDDFCCRFDLPPAAVLLHPDIYVVYK